MQVVGFGRQAKIDGWHSQFIIDSEYFIQGVFAAFYCSTPSPKWLVKGVLEHLITPMDKCLVMSDLSMFKWCVFTCDCIIMSTSSSHQCHAVF